MVFNFFWNAQSLMKKSYNQCSNTNVFARKHKIIKPSTFYLLRKYTASLDGVNNKRFSKATFVNRNFLTENLELRVFQCLPCRAALLPLSPQYCLSLAQNAFPQCCWILPQLYPPLLLRFRFSYPENRNNLYRQCFHLSTAGDLL